LKALEEMLQDATAGDPISGLKWTRKTTRKLAEELKRKEFQVGHSTIPRLVRKLSYTLRSNQKRLSRKQDERRDEQMRHLTRIRKRFLKRKLPVLSVDCKKKELIGQFRNPGRTWRQQPLQVLETDFPSDAKGKAVPYGIYDVQYNEGYMVVGVSHETATFAMMAIQRWWLEVGQARYPGCRHILLQADAGGANACDSWLWKAALQTLADRFGITITVNHFPAGASKWNLIEHRMFCIISQNWAGQPLDCYETMLKFIRNSTTQTGFRCQARFDQRKYRSKQKISSDEKTNLNLQYYRLLPEWNYTIKPHGT
jgi:hypothetical protein